jgi:hypothetical protein
MSPAAQGIQLMIDVLSDIEPSKYMRIEHSLQRAGRRKKGLISRNEISRSAFAGAEVRGFRRQQAWPRLAEIRPINK